MACADQPQESYLSYLEVVSNHISQLASDSPIIIAGDPNCHLGHLGGPRSSDHANARGLYVPSLCHLAS